MTAPRDELLRAADVERLYGVNRKTLDRMRSEGVGPQWRRMSPRRIAYRRSDVETWIAGLQQDGAVA